MSTKSFIALLLGLVIQLSQIPLCLAGAAAKPCATSAQSMSCCADLQSCPCASGSDQKQKPTPLIPASVDLKLLISKAPETNSLAALIFPPTDAVAPTVSVWEGRFAYAGVPLSVAFCSFVI